MLNFFMHKKSNREKFRSGFTLVEVMAVAVLSGLIFAAAGAAAFPLARFLRIERSELTVSDELCIALESIKRDALMASGFTLPAGNGGNQLDLIVTTDFTAAPPATTTIPYRLNTGILTRGATVIADELVTVGYNTIANRNNCFTATLTKNNNRTGQPITKRASVMLRCRDTFLP